MINLEVAMGLFPERAEEIQQAIGRMKEELDSLKNIYDVI